MKRYGNGFTLIELSIALLITASLSLMIYQTFSRVRRASQNTGDMIDATNALAVARNQMMRDITGMFAANTVLQELEAQLNPEQKKETKGTNVKKSQPAPKKEGKKDVVWPCLLTVKNKKTPSLSFATTNRLGFYDDVNPYNSRVRYTLEPQSDGLFRLMRQEIAGAESSPKDFEKQKVPAYQLLSGIKKFEILLFAPQKKEDEQKKEAGVSGQKPQQKKEEKKEPPKLITYSEWSDALKQRFKKDPYNTVIPAYCTVKGVLVTSAGREYPFEWSFEISSFAGVEAAFKEFRNKKDRERRRTKTIEKKKQQQIPGMPVNLERLEQNVQKFKEQEKRGKRVRNGL